MPKLNDNVWWELIMKTFEEVKSEIESLPEQEYRKLLHWLSEQDAANWDRQIAQDANSGTLDFLVEEALAEKKAGNLRSL